MPPGPLIQSINTRLHAEPFSTLFYTVYWSVLLITATPVCILGLLARGIYKLFHFGSKSNLSYHDPSINHPTKPTCEMAVFITGCDTGFGQEIALLAASKGFVVFAGCLVQESFSQFESVENVTPLLVDVTQDDQVQAAARSVQDWIRAGDDNKKCRVLHAILNNAGIGMGGLIDWLPLSAFQKVMDVNYFGIIRVCQAFMPLLKEQAIQKAHTGARILNVVSMAGLVPGGSGLGTYGPSKFAATALSTVLRHELKAFGIQVSTINPSFHGTPLVNQMKDDMTRTWRALNEKTRAQYGDEFLERFLFMAADIPQALSWKIDAVVDAVMTALQARYIEPEILVGMDGRFGLVALRMFPAWLIDLLDGLVPRPIPAVMKAKN